MNTDKDFDIGWIPIKLSKRIYTPYISIQLIYHLIIHL
jgi:hypothetical protein